MKRLPVIFIMLLAFCLCACNVQEKPAVPTAQPTTQSTEVPLTETTLSEQITLPLPEETAEFSFLSGAGGWRTMMTVNRDGSFTGYFQDSEMGEASDAYPHGSVYVCDFSGKFTGIEQVNEYTFRMFLSNVTTEQKPGDEWIQDNIRYVASEPHGIEEGHEFLFYLPDTPIDQVPEEFLIWWPYRYDQTTDVKSTLFCYGILNTATNYGFFFTEEIY